MTTQNKKQSHTPAPWMVAWQAANGKYDSNGQYWIRQSVGIKAGESEANARLIAAAPELLEALKKCRETLIGMKAFLNSMGATYGMGLTFQMIDEAITKAEGTL